MIYSFICILIAVNWRELKKIEFPFSELITVILLAINESIEKFDYFFCEDFKCRMKSFQFCKII